MRFSVMLLYNSCARALSSSSSRASMSEIEEKSTGNIKRCFAIATDFPNRSTVYAECRVLCFDKVILTSLISSVFSEVPFYLHQRENSACKYRIQIHNSDICMSEYVCQIHNSDNGQIKHIFSI